MANNIAVIPSLHLRPRLNLLKGSRQKIVKTVTPLEGNYARTQDAM
ncbi:MAG: hypothetical protein AAF597_17440 [Bacteroidota bacterium]